MKVFLFFCKNLNRVIYPVQGFNNLFIKIYDIKKFVIQTFGILIFNEYDI